MMHPVQHLAFWATKAPEIEAMASKYDALVGNDPERKKQLDELLTWARYEAILDEGYSDGYNASEYDDLQ